MNRSRDTLPTMPERPAVSQDDLRNLLVCKPVHLRLLKLANNRTRSATEAKELVSEVTLMLLNGESPWRPDPDRPVTDQLSAFIVHVALLIRRCHGNRVGTREVRRRAEFPKTFADHIGDGRANAEEAALELEAKQDCELRAARWIDALCGKMAGDSEALKIIDQHRRGVHEAEPQASALGWRLARVVLAKRRIAYQAAKVAAEQREAETQAEERRIATAHAANKERMKP